MNDKASTFTHLSSVNAATGEDLGGAPDIMAAAGWHMAGDAGSVMVGNHLYTEMLP